MFTFVLIKIFAWHAKNGERIVNKYRIWNNGEQNVNKPCQPLKLAHSVKNFALWHVELNRPKLTRIQRESARYTVNKRESTILSHSTFDISQKRYISKTIYMKNHISDSLNVYTCTFWNMLIRQCQNCVNPQIFFLIALAYPLGLILYTNRWRSPKIPCQLSKLVIDTTFVIIRIGMRGTNQERIGNMERIGNESGTPKNGGVCPPSGN